MPKRLSLGVVVKVLQNLLELSRMDTDARRQHNVPLPRAAAEVARQLREMAQSAGVRVQLDNLPDVEVNASAVELCLTNYLSNAIKYSDADNEITVSATPDLKKGCLVVSVKDTGFGIPESEIPNLFKKFYRIKNDASRRISGTGLGLYIVKQMVEAHSGQIWVESKLHEGSTFSFSLPFSAG